jgi:mannose PTS system EIIA component
MGFSCSDTGASAPPPGDKLRSMNGILIVAHAPLASALRACVLHVFPDSASAVSALDVMPNAPPEESLAQARILLRQLDTPQTLVLTDVFGATPCNVAHKLVDGVHSKLIAGVNLPMLLRTVSYRHESLDALVSRAMVGATQGVIQVAVTAPQNQARRTTHDQDHRDHQQ